MSVRSVKVARWLGRGRCQRWQRGSSEGGYNIQKCGERIFRVTRGVDGKEGWRNMRSRSGEPATSLLVLRLTFLVLRLTFLALLPRTPHGRCSPVVLRRACHPSLPQCSSRSSRSSQVSFAV